jgi:hypothetical protein
VSRKLDTQKLKNSIWRVNVGFDVSCYYVEFYESTL